MSSILYVIDGYLSSEDKVEVTIELINQLKKLDPNRKIMLINKFNNSWGINNMVDYYEEYLDGFLVGYPPKDILEKKEYSMPYVYFEIGSGVLENWMPLVGVSDHVANVYNGFIFASNKAKELGYDRVFRIEYDMLFDEEEFKIILNDLKVFENEEFLIYGKRQEGEWASKNQALIDLHFCGYSTKMIEGFDYVKNNEEYWNLCKKIKYVGKWAEYIMYMTFQCNFNDETKGKIYSDFVRLKFSKSNFDRISSSGLWSDKWKNVPKICRLDVNNGFHPDESKLVIFYLNKDYDSIEVETICNKDYYKKITLGMDGWYYDVIDRESDMVFMSKITHGKETNTFVTYVNNETYDKLNCRFIIK